MRILILLALSTITVLSAPLFTATAAPYDFNTLPEQYKEYIPKELMDYLTSLTLEEQRILMDYSKSGKDVSYLKEHHPAVYAKAEKLAKVVIAKFQRLDPTVQALLKKAAVAAVVVHQEYLSEGKIEIGEVKKMIREFISDYQALSEEARETVNTEFPSVLKLSQNEKVKTIVAMFLD